MMRNAIVAILLILPTLRAATIRVPQNQPTIQSAINVASNRDTVLVGPGTFIGAFNYLGKSVVVKSEFGIGSVIITSPTPIGELVSFHSGEDTLSTLDGFSFEGMTTNGSETGIVSLVGSSGTIRNCAFKNNTATMSPEQASPMIHHVKGGYVIIERCEFSSNESFGGPVYVAAAQGRIANNIFKDNVARWEGSAIVIAGIYGQSTCLIERNLFLTNTSLGGSGAYSPATGGAIFLSENTGTIVRNNTFVGNEDASADGGAIGVWYYCSDIVIRNNIFLENLGFAVANSHGSQVSLFCNDAIGNQPADYVGALFPDVSSFSLNPLFCNAQFGDFRLLDNSPCSPANNNCGALVGGFSVGCENHAPVIVNTGSKSVNENTIVDFTLSASDVDNDVLSFSASLLPAGATLNPTNGNFNWKPTFDQAGVYLLNFSVSDGFASDSESLQITVINVNRVPWLTSPGNKTADEDDIISFSIIATDPDFDQLIYSASPLPSGATLNGSSGFFYWQTTHEQAGTYNLNFTVSDGQATDQQTIQIVVNNVNRPPSTFDLVSPANGDTVKSANALLRWHRAIDPDIGNGVTYSLSYSKGDTTSWQNTIPALVDSQYTIGPLEERSKYFWKVAAQDNESASVHSAHTFSFIAADLTPPTFVVDILSNPILPFELDLYFYPSEQLNGPPQVTITRSTGTNLYPAAQLSNRDTPCYVTDYQVTQSGSVTIFACGTDVSANHGCTNESFSAARLFANIGTEMQGPSGFFRLNVPSGSARDNGLIFCRELSLNGINTNNSDFPLDAIPAFVLELTSTVALSRNSLLSINSEAAGIEVGAGSTVILVSLDNVEAHTIPSRINISTGEFIVEIPRTGTYVVCTAEIGKLETLPSAFQLDQNTPNPFNGFTEIPFSSSELAHVTVEVFNILGQKVRMLLDKDILPGNYSLSWNGKTDSGTECSSGTYFYRLSAGSHIETKKMLYLK